MAEIPTWAKQRAIELVGEDPAWVGVYSMRDFSTGNSPALTTFAAYLAAHEEAPLWQVACDIIRAEYGPTRHSNGTLQLGEGPARVEHILNGGKDYWEARCILTALRRGMELAKESAS